MWPMFVVCWYPGWDSVMRLVKGCYHNSCVDQLCQLACGNIPYWLLIKQLNQWNIIRLFMPCWVMCFICSACLHLCVTVCLASVCDFPVVCAQCVIWETMSAMITIMRLITGAVPSSSLLTLSPSSESRVKHERGVSLSFSCSCIKKWGMEFVRTGSVCVRV